MSPSMPLRESVVSSTMSRKESVTASGDFSRWPRSRRRYTGVSASSGMMSMMPRWFGSPVIAFGR